MEEGKYKANPIQPTLMDMKVGDTVPFPIRRLGSVKNSCSHVGTQYDRKFKTSLDRKAQTVKVTRIK